MNVLIVEDETITALYIRSVVERYGHDVVATVTSAEDAIAVGHREKIELVFMDINLRGAQDGIQCVREMVKRHAVLRFCYISSYADRETLESAIDLHTSGFIVKPVDETQLLIALTIVERQRPEVLTVLKRHISFAKHYTYDCEANTLQDHIGLIELTRQEFKLLKIMLESPCMPLSVETIAIKLYRGEKSSNTAIRNLIRRLRQKLPDAIVTSKGDGYLIKEVSVYYV